MSRSKAEVRAWLRSQVGKKVKDESNHDLDGQCVALVKALLNYLGAPDPWKARGNAKSVINAYIADGVAQRGDGWLRVCSNSNMGNGYGHVWIDLRGETNFEQNGQRPLLTTEGTRPIGQCIQLASLDKWVVERPVAQAPRQDLPSGVIPQNGTFHVEVDGLRVRNNPDTNGNNVVATYNRGQSVNYQGYIDANGYRWVVYKANSGNWRYVARRTLDGQIIFGHCN